ncbi:Ribosomal N-lysine methyltransferase set11 [Termitomyces sp. T112]|nr:Ribosomal N-lysine methyltransferase set11 [Termitomyces sp. T112]
MTDALQQVHPDWQTLLDWLATHGMDTSSAAISIQARTSPGSSSLSRVTPHSNIVVQLEGAGYGLFALRNCDPAIQLLSVPASALLNMATLSNLPNGSQPSSDPIFGPYISTLPRDFESHPLTWLCSGKLENTSSLLLSYLPPSIALALQEVCNRYRSDWAIVKQYIQQQQSNFLPSLCEIVRPVIRALQLKATQCEEDFLWAWLNVNTRCLYYRLTQLASDKDNVTMCPVIDFANHTNHSNHMSPQEPIAGRTKAPSKSYGLNFQFISPSSTVTKQDDELFLKYGAHSNQILFVEYGFVSEISAELLLRGDAIGQIALQSELLDLFESRGKLGAWMKDILRTEGYWGDWTLHCQPPPAHPSFRLITALRLYHHFPIKEMTVPPNAASALESWMATIMGTSEKISEENEEAWRNSLLRICRKRASDAKSALSSLKRKMYPSNPTWISLAKQNIMTLWEEELLVSTQVSDSILQHEEF